MTQLVRGVVIKNIWNGWMRYTPATNRIFGIQLRVDPLEMPICCFHYILNDPFSKHQLIGFISNMYNSDWFMTWYNMQSQCHNYKMSRLCNWLSFQCLVPWINHLPINWSASYISNLKWHWIRTFGMIDSTFFILLIMLIYIYIYMDLDISLCLMIW